MHHSSFVGGESVQAAGMFIIENGVLLKLFAHSGHYRPTERNVLQLLCYLKHMNVNLNDVEVDAQRIAKISRDSNGTGAKKKKIETTVMWQALYMIDFLNHKFCNPFSGFNMTQLKPVLTIRKPSSNTAFTHTEILTPITYHISNSNTVGLDTCSINLTDKLSTVFSLLDTSDKLGT